LLTFAQVGTARAEGPSPTRSEAPFPGDASPGRDVCRAARGVALRQRRVASNWRSIMRRTSLVASAASLALVCLAPALASAATWQVGPDKPIRQLEELSESLQPGDVVELDGDATYTGDVWMEALGTA